ncbi:MAG: hypothetical protein KC668_00565 [Myxococcales bacterium]|nr:hypothetical protein [Myxococcales bacterium]
MVTGRDAPSAGLDPLCDRLRAERGELDLGAALRDRVRAFPAEAERWLAEPHGAAPRAALRAVLEHPEDPAALAQLHQHARAFAGAPSLLVDATVTSLYAIDVAAGAGNNATTVALVAQARAWLPTEPSLPRLEALLLPERGGRRRLLDEARALGDDEPALLVALARAALREGDAASALRWIERARESGRPGAGGVASALRERAQQVASGEVGFTGAPDRGETSRVGRRPTPLDAAVPRVRVVAPASTPDARAQLAEEVRRDLRDAATLLGQPPREELVVWVHADVDALRAATCGAAWSQALYDGVLHVVVPGERLDDALRRSVRHEALHAALDAATPLAPRWFHEGVAQRFAGETPSVAVPSVALHAHALADTEAHLALGVDGQTAGHAYATARALVDALIARDGEPVLASVVRALRSGVPPGAIATELGLPGAPQTPPR